MPHQIRIAVVVLSVLLLAVPVAPAVEEKDIQRAVDLGVRYLRSSQAHDGRWEYNEIGATALAGLALLECGVPPADRQIQAAAGAIRQGSTRLSSTYSLALSLLFLDRLGEKDDEDLILLLGLRLLAGQTAEGGWTYVCPEGGTVEEVRRNRRLGGEKAAAGPERGKEKPAPEPPAPGPLDLPRFAGPRPLGVDAAVGAPMGGGDNSNTQFAMLGLWGARRHGLDVDLALAVCDRRFRLSQNGDGGWSYTSGLGGQMGGSTPAMTCAGLLALGFGFGIESDPANEDEKPKGKAKPGAARPRMPRDPSRDPGVRNALLALGNTIGQPAGRRDMGPGMAQWAQLGRGYYFLWSLERVGMAFDLKTIGKKDWYSWGAEIIVATQQPNGSWAGSYPQGGVDTAFALLFLRRSNLVQDLTSRLRGRVNDPGEIRLTRGGIGGEGLKVGKGMQPAIQLRERGKADKGGAEPPSARAGTASREKGNKGAATGNGTEAEQLTARLLKAPESQQQGLLDQLRDGKGAAYTSALADVIPELSGPVKSRAREALAERLSRMTAETLREKLRDEDLEIRRAAALACASKEDKQYVPDLIALLKDPEPPVARAAQVALKELTRRDFGPAVDASRAEREQAIARWQEWWEKQKEK